MKMRVGFLSLMCHIFYFQGARAYVYTGGSTSWEDWWTYDGISGPDFWGLLNLEWGLCNKGRRQSPINIDPTGLLYDPSLRPLQVDKTRVNGIITNTGHGVIFRTAHTTFAEILNISGGPLSYKYRFSELHIHFAKTDEKGSEHLIAGHQFPAEIQLYGYNSDLYQNISEAMSLQKNQGLVAISILLQSGNLSNPELRVITSQLSKIYHRGQESSLKHLSIRDLLPDTDYYMTYEGSTTMPGCYETVTWIVMNKPIYITKQQLYALRRLMQGDEKNPKAPLADNFRPVLDLNQRTIRTNIDFRKAPQTFVIGRKALDKDSPHLCVLAASEKRTDRILHVNVKKICSVLIVIVIIINIISMFRTRNCVMILRDCIMAKSSSFNQCLSSSIFSGAEVPLHMHQTGRCSLLCV